MNMQFYKVVKSFNKKKKYHKFVYDNKEEKWIKLHKEIFKFQVLKREVFDIQKSDVVVLLIDFTCMDAKIKSFYGKKKNTNQQELSNRKLIELKNRKI